MQVDIRVNNKNKLKVYKGETFYDALKANDMVDGVFGICVNNVVQSMHDKIESPCEVKTLGRYDAMGIKIYTAGLRMLFEYAVFKKYPGAKVKFIYNLPTGIIAQIDYNKDLTKEDCSILKNFVDDIISEDIKIEKMIIKSSEVLEFYKEAVNTIKYDNISNIIDNTVVMYRLNDLVNYYYSEMPYSTGFTKNFDLKLIKSNMFIIGFSEFLPKGRSADYSEYKGIIKTYSEGIDWLNLVGTPTINYVNRLISNGSIKSYVKSCELRFNQEINKIAEYVFKHPSIKCVMLSGPSSSGKTTITNRLANYLEVYGYEPIVVSLDGYFLEREETPKDENGEYDFECLEALDLDYLTKDVIKLFNGESVRLSDFNFVTGTKFLSDNEVKLSEKGIILFEGLHAINDDLLPLIPSNLKYKIFISPFMPLGVDDQNYISSDELRLLRRITRDFRTRGYGVEHTIQSWRKVHYGEEKYINPHIVDADVIIDTSLPYEVGALKVFVEPLLYAVDTSSPYYNDSRVLLNFLKQFFAIPSEYIPGDSVIREFIGGKND